jgi:hypothetical protein
MVTQRALGANLVMIEAPTIITATNKLLSCDPVASVAGSLKAEKNSQTPSTRLTGSNHRGGCQWSGCGGAGGRGGAGSCGSGGCGSITSQVTAGERA